MDAWCNTCGKYIHTDRHITRRETMTQNGLTFAADQTYGICPHCQQLTLTADQIYENNVNVILAYRTALHNAEDY